MDSQINRLTEQETTKMLELLEGMAKRLGASSGEPEVMVLKGCRPDSSRGRPT